MPELLHPGVYPVEVPPAVRPIEGVSTSTTAFIGAADKGPVAGAKLPTGEVAEPVLVTSYPEYLRQFGGFRRDSFLTYAAKAYFDNQGRRLYVVRVTGEDAKTATLPATGSARFTIEAKTPGAWAGLLTVAVADATDVNPDHFDLTVSGPGGSGGLVEFERFPNLTTSDAKSTVTDATNGSKFVTLAANPTTRPPTAVAVVAAPGADPEDPTAAAAVEAGATNKLNVVARYPGAWANGQLKVTVADATSGTASEFDLVVSFRGKVAERFRNLTFRTATEIPPNYARQVVEGQSRYIRIGRSLRARPDNVSDAALAGGADPTAAADQVTAKWQFGGLLPVSAANPGKWGNSVWVGVTPAGGGNADEFRLLVMAGASAEEARGNVVESYDDVAFATDTNDPPANYVRTTVNSRSAYIAITDNVESRPADTSTPSGTGQRVLVPTRLAGGDDGSAPSDTNHTDALSTLDGVTDVSLIAIPGLGTKAVVDAAMAYCKTRTLSDCFFLADVGLLAPTAARATGAQPADVITPAQARDFARSLNRSFGDYGAIYYPWVFAADPIGTGRNPRILLPPSPFVAGICARIDNTRGVFKAPAGLEAGVAGALSPATAVDDRSQDILNPNQVNVIRTVPGGGLVVWGTRTIGSDPGWRYVPVRRMAIFLRVSIYNGIQWAVFEPNDEPLWAALRLNIRAFMLTQFRAGAFQGGKPDDAFFVRCDATTTTQQDIDNGVVNILVGFAPLKPAEFVVLKLSQKVNQPAE